MRVSTMLGGALAIGLLIAVSAAAQSLGDVARKEEARRKGVTAPAKVYTNDNLKSVDAPPPPPPATSPAPATQADAAPAPDAAAASPAAPSSADAKAPADKPRDEKYWRRRLDATRASLGRAQIFQDALQSRINALSTDFVNRDDPAQRNAIAADRQKALAELERVKQEIAQHQKAIADIQEEGRRAGAPAGWLR